MADLGFPIPAARPTLTDLRRSLAQFAVFSAVPAFGSHRTRIKDLYGRLKPAYAALRVWVVRPHTVWHETHPPLLCSFAFLSGILFLITLIVGAIVNFIVSQLVEKTGLSGTDKALGVVFGAARGLLIVTMVVLLASLTPMPEADWWQGSALLGFFEQLAGWLRGVVPADAVGKFNF